MITLTTCFNDILLDCGSFLYSQLREYSSINKYSYSSFRVEHFARANPSFTRNPSWCKIIDSSYMIKSMEDKDWVVYIDCDCAIVNKYYRLDFLGSSDKSFLISTGDTGLEPTVFAWKKSEFTKIFFDVLNFLKDVGQEYNKEIGSDEKPQHEQNTIRLLAKYFPYVKDNIGFFPNDFIQSGSQVNDKVFLWHYGKKLSIEEKKIFLDKAVKPSLGIQKQNFEI